MPKALWRRKSKKIFLVLWISIEFADCNDIEQYRTRNPLKLKASIEKRKFQKGDEYVIKSKSETQTIVVEKMCKPQYLCLCWLRCSQEIDVVTQQCFISTIFITWKIGWKKHCIEDSCKKRNANKKNLNPNITCKNSRRMSLKRAP